MDLLPAVGLSKEEWWLRKGLSDPSQKGYVVLHRLYRAVYFAPAGLITRPFH